MNPHVSYGMFPLESVSFSLYLYVHNVKYSTCSYIQSIFLIIVFFICSEHIRSVLSFLAYSIIQCNHKHLYPDGICLKTVMCSTKPQSRSVKQNVVFYFNFNCVLLHCNLLPSGSCVCFSSLPVLVVVVELVITNSCVYVDNQQPGRTRVNIKTCVRNCHSSTSSLLQKYTFQES